jgi:transposase
MLRELNVVEQRYRAVLEVLFGIPVVEVAERYGVARQTVHRWMGRYEADGIDGLADRSHAPKAHPWRIAADVEAVICELRRAHRRWGPRRLVFELDRRGFPAAHILTCTLTRTVACPIPEQERSRLRGARPGQPRLPEPQIVRRRVSSRGAIVIGGQRIQVGLPHADKTADITIEANTYRITIEDALTFIAPRATSRDIRRHKASRYPRPQAGRPIRP